MSPFDDDEREDQLDDGYEPDFDGPEFPEDESTLPDDDQLVPADWVEGHDDNTASERGSHWEDE